MEFIYPAKFEKSEEGGYVVTFPDIIGAITEGDTLKESFDMAEDCLGGVLVGFEEDGKEPPLASALTDFPANTDNEFFSLIKVDVSEYRRKINDKPIRKTVYIPKGLNDEAELLGINFSKILRNALAAELGK